jgi:hypothetical protein
MNEGRIIVYLVVRLAWLLFLFSASIEMIFEHGFLVEHNLACLLWFAKVVGNNVCENVGEECTLDEFFVFFGVYRPRMPIPDFDGSPRSSDAGLRSRHWPFLALNNKNRVNIVPSKSYKIINDIVNWRKYIWTSITL